MKVTGRRAILLIAVAAAVILVSNQAFSIIGNYNQVRIDSCTRNGAILECPSDNFVEGDRFTGGLYGDTAFNVREHLDDQVIQQYMLDNGVTLADTNNDGKPNKITAGWTGTCTLVFTGEEDVQDTPTTVRSTMTGELSNPENLGCIADGSTRETVCINGACGEIDNLENFMQFARGQYTVRYDVEQSTVEEPVDETSPGEPGSDPVVEPVSSVFEQVYTALLDVWNQFTSLFQ